MHDSVIRFQYNVTITDTTGFFDYCIPGTNELDMLQVDSLKKYFNQSAYDYISPPPKPRQLTEAPSVFGQHQLVPSHFNPRTINRQSTDWITILLMICLFIFAWIQTFYSKRFSQIFRAAAQPHFVNQLEREGNLFKERITLGLGFIYYGVLSVFIYQLFNSVGLIPSGMNNIGFTALIFGSLFTFQMLKSLIVYSSGIVFETRESARSHQLNILIFNHITGVTLFPFTIMALYWESPVFLYIGGLSALIITLYGFFRSILTGLNNKNYNLFYLFLYLCTLEILPVLVLLKVISKI
jgi:hypothetical protein